MNTQLARKLNNEIIKNSKKPHQRDLARMRKHIIRNAMKRRRESNHER